MRVESVDLFYLSMPQIRDVGDGSQDMLLVRIRAGDHTGWGECEASPLTSIASFVTPMSHSACHPVQDSVLGQRLDTPEDIHRIAREVRANSLDLLQADHTLAGVEMALWDLLGKALERPVFELLGYRRAEPKTPYASVLFGDTPEETLHKARAIRSEGFRAAKFGWGGFGKTTAAADADQLHAAREGLGEDGVLLVDAGTIWIEDVEAALQRLPALEDAGVLWLEEPFVSGALRAYHALAERCTTLTLAGGEGAHDAHQAEHLIDHGGISFVQIDTGRMGLGDAKRVADYALGKDVRFVNHTFTSHLALSASLQPFAGSSADWLCEYPLEAQRLATALTHERLTVDSDGRIAAPDAPGLGMNPNLPAVQEYLVDAQLIVSGRTLYTTPELTL
jgi:L-alanine-DL-glutamate epimerase-like enolase superfamily enzyme